MTYEQVKQLKPEHFKRLCGVRPETFVKMVELLSPNLGFGKRGGQPKLSVEDQLLMTLEYWREGEHVLSYCSILELTRIDGLANSEKGRNAL